MPNGQGASDPLDAVLARQALHDINALYGRALDRCDLPLLASLFHPGDRAAGEYYLFSAFSYETDSDGVEGFVGGRYAAQFERRDGVWKYAHLMLVMDWNMNNPSTAQWHLRFGVRGDRKPADLLYSGLFQ